MSCDGQIMVLLVDDHPLVRQGLQAVLSAVDDIIVVGEASDGRAAVELAAELEPDVIIMDLQVPGLHGIDATREIMAVRPGIAVLVLTMFEDDDMVFAAVSAGAAGYLLKGANGADIVTAVRAAGAGQAVFGTALAQRLRTWFTRGPQPPAAPYWHEPDVPCKGRHPEELAMAGKVIGASLHLAGDPFFLDPYRARPARRFRILARIPADCGPTA